MRTNQRWMRAGASVGLALSAAACAATPIVPPGVPPGVPAMAMLAPPPPGAVVCSANGSDQERDVGPRGDSIVAASSYGGGVRRHVLTVPAGAVPPGQMVRFRLVEPQSGVVRVIATSNPDVEFNQDLILRLSYEGCAVEDPTRLRILRWNGGSWDTVPGSTLRRDIQAVQAPRRDLSEYALGAI